ncbi:hypothetical protein PHISCL_06894 [Aspergillus sclerotialis]|uniref:Uncharacterized protein n=1 Tax=Aspergillus sclerotialis TaxID=2070753 RepID=A0A3A2ZS26_9EURO|nr:hypothetical protein PHISCL_06894 [Aspergillus sclerotialis]
MLRRHSAPVFGLRQERRGAIPRAQAADNTDSVTDDEVEVVFDLDERALAELPPFLQANMKAVHAERLSRLQSQGDQVETSQQNDNSVRQQPGTITTVPVQTPQITTLSRGLLQASSSTEQLEVAPFGASGPVDDAMLEGQQGGTSSPKSGTMTGEQQNTFRAPSSTISVDEQQNISSNASDGAMIGNQRTDESGHIHGIITDEEEEDFSYPHGAVMDEQRIGSPGPTIDEMIGEHQDDGSVISCTIMTYEQEACRDPERSRPKKVSGSDNAEVSEREAALAIPRMYSPHLRKRKRADKCPPNSKSRATRLYVPAAKYMGDVVEETQGHHQLRARVSSIFNSVRGKLRKGVKKIWELLKK